MVADLRSRLEYIGVQVGKDEDTDRAAEAYGLRRLSVTEVLDYQGLTTHTTVPMAVYQERPKQLRKWRGIKSGSMAPNGDFTECCIVCTKPWSNHYGYGCDDYSKIPATPDDPPF